MEIEGVEALKAISIDLGGGVELADWDFDEALAGGACFDAIALGKDHTIYVNDDALFRARVTVTDIADCPKVPLPAVIVGRDGEHDTDVTLTVNEVSAMIGDLHWFL